jgi:hypothetical protein
MNFFVLHEIWSQGKLSINLFIYLSELGKSIHSFALYEKVKRATCVFDTSTNRIRRHRRSDG